MTNEFLPQGEAAALLRDQDNLLILTHRRPDGDTTGCAAALYAVFYPELIGLYVPTWYAQYFLRWLPSWPL